MDDRERAMDPNTPPDALLVLAARYPREVLENPTFGLLFLERGNFLRELPKRTLVELAFSSDTAPVWTDVLFEELERRDALACLEERGIVGPEADARYEELKLEWRARKKKDEPEPT